MTRWIRRMAQVSYAFVVMNVAAVYGPIALGLGKRVWR